MSNNQRFTKHDPIETETTYPVVSTAPVKVQRDDGEGGTYEDTIPGCRFAVHRAKGHADAIEQAFSALRKEFGIPSNVHIKATVIDEMLAIGTSCMSLSGKARFKGESIDGRETVDA